MKNGKGWRLLVAMDMAGLVKWWVPPATPKHEPTCYSNKHYFDTSDEETIRANCSCGYYSTVAEPVSIPLEFSINGGAFYPRYIYLPVSLLRVATSTLYVEPKRDTSNDGVGVYRAS